MIRLSQINGVGVGLASHVSFRLPLERFDGFTMRFIEWTIFYAKVPSLYVDSSHINPR